LGRSKAPPKRQSVAAVSQRYATQKGGEMKFCKNCKHCVPHPGTGLKLAKCGRTQKPIPDFRVTGEGEQFEMAYCSTERIGPSILQNCGTEAQFFEQKSDSFSTTPDYSGMQQ
jgi:hypothetical protein